MILEVGSRKYEVLFGSKWGREEEMEGGVTVSFYMAQ